MPFDLNSKRKRVVSGSFIRKKRPKLYISNLSPETEWSEVKDLFFKITGEIVYIELFVDKNYKRCGTGNVQFKTISGMAKALELNSTHKFVLDGRQLKLRDDSGIERDKYGKRILDNLPKSNRDDASKTIYQHPHNMYGLSAKFLESLQIHGPLSNRIHLHVEADKAKIKEVFKMAGKIRNIYMGQRNGINDCISATIEYEHPIEAVQAISMFNKRKLFDLQMNLFMDNVDTTNKLLIPLGLEGIGPGLGLNGEPLREVTKYLPPDNTGSFGAQSIGINIGVLESIPIYTSKNGNFTIQPLGLLEQGIDVPNLNNPQGLPAAGQLQNMPNTIQNGVNPNINMPIFSQPPFDVSNMPRHIDNQQHMAPPYLPISNTFSTNTFPKTNKNMDTILVENLPSSITWEILHETFGAAGPIDFAESVAAYSVMIKFRDSLSAIQAIKMYDRTCIDGRKIDIHYY